MSGFASKRIEFDTVKIRIIQLLPQPRILNCIDSAHPILYYKSWIFRVFVLCNIRKRKIIVFVDMNFLIKNNNLEPNNDFWAFGKLVIFNSIFLSGPREQLKNVGYPIRHYPRFSASLIRKNIERIRHIHARISSIASSRFQNTLFPFPGWLLVFYKIRWRGRSNPNSSIRVWHSPRLLPIRLAG